MLTTEKNIMFRRAGFGEQWQTNHYLGRASVTPSPALQELVLPGLAELVAQAQPGAAAHLLASPAHCIFCEMRR